MEIKKQAVVLSLAGRDKGRMFVVLDLNGESYAVIADGRLRKVQKPKTKKVKHLKVLGEINLKDLASSTNRELHSALRSFKEQQNTVTEGGFQLVKG